jgi:hypothetical protein
MWRLVNVGTSEVYATLKVGPYTVGRAAAAQDGGELRNPYPFRALCCAPGVRLR